MSCHFFFLAYNLCFALLGGEGPKPVGRRGRLCLGTRGCVCGPRFLRVLPPPFLPCPFPSSPWVPLLPSPVSISWLVSSGKIQTLLACISSSVSGAGQPYLAALLLGLEGLTVLSRAGLGMTENEHLMLLCLPPLAFLLRWLSAPFVPPSLPALPPPVFFDSFTQVSDFPAIKFTHSECVSQGLSELRLMDPSPSPVFWTISITPKRSSVPFVPPCSHLSLGQPRIFCLEQICLFWAFPVSGSRACLLPSVSGFIHSVIPCTSSSLLSCLSTAFFFLPSTVPLCGQTSVCLLTS